MINLSPDMASKFGLLMSFVENDKSPSAKAIQALIVGLADEAKAKSPIGLLVVDFLRKAGDMKDPVYDGLDPMFKQSLHGMLKTVSLMLDD